MNLIRLRFSMLGTLAVIIGVSTLGLGALLAVTGLFNIYSLVFLVALFNIIQWLLAPYLINSIYGVSPLDPDEDPHLHNVVRELSARSGIKPPKLMISKLPIPNAFAYSSPLTGSHVAVTKGLLSDLDGEEVEAVIGHELGHLKHRDVQVMMFVSFLPSLFYLLARSTLYTRYYGSRDRGGGGGLALIGSLSMLIYFFLLLFNLGFSRLREYYADQHGASIVDDGPRKLSEGLAKISTATWNSVKGQQRRIAVSGFKALFISDPDRAARDAMEIRQALYGGTDDELVRSLMDRRITGLDRFAELFSTHPNIVKRLHALRG
ncbi:MAG: M48 family metalloprotease [Candidatus Bathyarchaeota archaeon]|nr:MAG: M48 family metalloprotease [Candidatus Bathyarchaeota archaeon]